MIYRPEEPLRLWDTWLFRAPDGLFHLFHIERSPERANSYIAHVTSSDLLTWERHAPIYPQGEPGQWDDGNILTGMVFALGEGYAMTHGISQGPHQRNTIMFSDDLYTWRKSGWGPIFQAGPPYNTDPARNFGHVDWRDVFIIPRGEEYEAILCASLPTDEPGTGACIARLRSRDLRDWELLPPLAAPGRYYHMEVPEYFELGGKHYLLFTTGSHTGTQIDLPSRRQSEGTYYLVADQYEGPYELLTEDNLLIGAGEGRFDNYVARVINLEQEWLVYGHMCGPRPTWAAPKVLRQEPSGELWPAYWAGLKGLETGELRSGLTMPEAQKEIRTYGEWQPKAEALTIALQSAGSAFLLPEEAPNLHLSCDIELSRPGRAGVGIRFDGERGIGVLLDARHGELTWGELRPAAGFNLLRRDTVKAPVDVGRRYHVRLLARWEFMDVYLDDRLMFSAVVDGLPPSGRTLLLAEAVEARFGAFRLAELRD